MRLFFAIELPPLARQHLLRVIDVLRPAASGASWMPPGRLHLTLRFVGEMADSRVGELCGAAGGANAGGLFHLACDELAFLPQRAPARVVSAAVGGNLPSLLRLQGALEAVCRQLGCLAETRPYAAHITLARARQRIEDPLREQMERRVSGMFPGPQFDVDQFVLMQSDLSHAGASYTPLARWSV
jgi:2'-5' RNA ligase